MLVEAAVLDGDDRVLDVGGHLVQADFHPVLGVKGGNGFSVSGEDFG